MAVDRHIVGRVREHHAGMVAIHQYRQDGRIQGIPAHQPVGAQLPDIAQADSARRLVRKNVVFGIAGLLRDQSLDQTVDLGHLEADHPDVKADVLRRKQTLQLLGKQLIIPPGVQCQLVIGNDIGPLFRFGHVLDANAGDRVHSQGLGSLDPPMPGKDGVGLIDQHRIGEAEGPDRLRNLLQLLFRMGSSVARPPKVTASLETATSVAPQTHPALADHAAPNTLEIASTIPVSPDAQINAPVPRQTKTAMLRARLADPGGISAATLIAVTGWQAHTLRAALTGLRKTELTITRRQENGETIYSSMPLANEAGVADASGSAAAEQSVGVDEGTR